MNYAKNKKYFLLFEDCLPDDENEGPKKSLKLLIKSRRVLMMYGAGALLLGIMLLVLLPDIEENSRHSPLKVFLAGIIGAGWGCYTLFRAFTALSDSEYDSAAAKHLDSDALEDYALEQFGLSESDEITPITLAGYDFGDADMFRKGDDGKWRSNVCKIIVMFIAHGRFHAYTVRFKTTEEVYMSETADTYSCSDIVPVSAASSRENVMAGNKKLTVDSDVFRIAVKSGESISVNVTDQAYAEEAARVISELLGEKKQA